MEIQLIRNRLVEELTNLPDVTTPEIQSYALTTAVLVRRITKALNITNLSIQDAWRRETPHDLARVLSKIVHYEDFNRALVKPPEGELARYDYVYLRSERTEPALVINLESYFDHVRCFAYDDVFVARYILRRILTMLSQVVHQPEMDFDQDLLGEVVDRMYDSFALLGKLIRHRTLVVPTHRVIDGYPAVNGGTHILPSPCCCLAIPSMLTAERKCPHDGACDIDAARTGKTSGTQQLTGWIYDDGAGSDTDGTERTPYQAHTGGIQGEGSSRNSSRQQRSQPCQCYTEHTGDRSSTSGSDAIRRSQPHAPERVAEGARGYRHRSRHVTQDTD